MDSITQGVIGGWIMDKVVGETPEKASRWQRNKVLILGGLITNIPDLDIFIGKIIPHTDFMSEFLFHRGIMHSVFFSILVALLVGWICGRTDKYHRPRWRRALASYISILIGHLLLDAMTAYGGRYLLPFSDLTYSFDTIFVIDLFYTIPLIIIWFIYVFLKKKSQRKIAYIIGAIRIIIYPLFTFFAKQTANAAFENSLTQQGKPYGRLMTAPEPLQAFLWRGVVQAGVGYYEGYYSIFDSDTTITWRYIPNNVMLRTLVKDKPDIQKIEKRAKGWTSYSTDGDGHIIIKALKMGETIGWKQPKSINDGFIISASGDAIGQTRRGGSIRRGFGDIWDAHWQRVRGNK